MPSRKNSRAKKEEEELVCLTHLHNNRDRYGEQYKQLLNEDIVVIAQKCFFCAKETLFGTTIYKCSKCKYNFYFCKQHKMGMDVIFGFANCLYCERKRNDDIMKLLDSSYNPLNPEIDLRQDLYGINAVDDFLEKSMID